MAAHDALLCRKVRIVSTGSVVPPLIYGRQLNGLSLSPLEGSGIAPVN